MTLPGIKARGGLVAGALVSVVLSLMASGLAEQFLWEIRGETGHPLEGLTVCLDSVCTEVATDENGRVVVQADVNSWYALRLLYGDDLFFTDDLFVTAPLAFDGTVVTIVTPASP